MTLSLVQWTDPRGVPALAALTDDGVARRIHGVAGTLDLAQQALAGGHSLEQAVATCGLGDSVDLETARIEGRLRTAIDHPEPSRIWLTGTGLTHLGSAESRDKMHKAAAGGHVTDSMRMFQMGLDGGKPAEGADGVQPEWFYKGDGRALIATGQPLPAPEFALDFGEEPEIAGIYLIDSDGTPVRLGFALANEFSDHVTERQNYLWLAHSKLRPAGLGAELLTGPLPSHVAGTSRILRDGRTLWEKPFLSGEDNMSHSIANLEHHHFKYGLFRRPGDVHVHFFGTATLSCADGIQCQPGDHYEIRAEPFRLPLINGLVRIAAPGRTVRSL